MKSNYYCYVKPALSGALWFQEKTQRFVLVFLAHGIYDKVKISPYSQETSQTCIPQEMLPLLMGLCKTRKTCSVWGYLAHQPPQLICVRVVGSCAHSELISEGLWYPTHDKSEEERKLWVKERDRGRQNLNERVTRNAYLAATNNTAYHLTLQFYWVVICGCVMGKIGFAKALPWRKKGKTWVRFPLKCCSSLKNDCYKPIEIDNTTRCFYL